MSRSSEPGSLRGTWPLWLAGALWALDAVWLALAGSTLPGAAPGEGALGKGGLEQGDAGRRRVRERGGGAAVLQRGAFQRSVGGVGLSYALTPSWTFHAVDPRLAGGSEAERFPIPGLSTSDPHQGAAVVDLPPLWKSPKVP